MIDIQITYKLGLYLFTFLRGGSIKEDFIPTMRLFFLKSLFLTSMDRII